MHFAENMILFVNNIPLHIVDRSEEVSFSHVIDLWSDTLRFEEVSGSPLIRNATNQGILNFVRFLQVNSQPALKEVYFSVNDRKKFKSYLKKELQFVKAAGGVVENHEGKVLMMKRLGFWDLPKGKAEKREKSEVTAIREVEEECNVSVFTEKKLVTTWHTYFMKGKLVVKRTKWYRMKLISDSKMTPQTEEGIEELAWMDGRQLEEAVAQSYRSIAYVLEQYRLRKGVRAGEKKK